MILCAITFMIILLTAQCARSLSLSPCNQAGRQRKRVRMGADLQGRVLYFRLQRQERRSDAGALVRIFTAIKPD